MRKVVLVVAVLVAVFATSVYAAPIVPWNTRPQAVGSSGETSLQTILDTITGSPGSVNAFSDQQKAGMWALQNPAPGAIIPLLRFEFAGNASTNSFGLWSGTDTGGPFASKEIFAGSASPLSASSVVWLTQSTGYVNDVSNTFSGIPINRFGFYLGGRGTGSGADGKFWSVDQLNPDGGAQMFAYRQVVSNTWILAFEDIALNAGADGDRNDLVVSVESLVPVPEPGTMLLLGSGLVGLAGWGRKKFRK